MIRTVLLFFVLIASVIFSSCKKTTQQPGQSKPQLLSIKQDRSNGQPYHWVEEFIYQEDGRIKEIKSYGVNTDVSTIRYNYNSATLDRFYYLNSTERTSARLYYTFNQEGLIASETSLFYKYKMEHDYNAKGFITKTNFFAGVEPIGYAIYSYGTKHRLDSVAYYNADSTISHVSVFTFSTDKPNTIGKENKGQQMFGKDQAWPLIKETQFAYDFPSAPGKRSKLFELDYSYTYNEKGLIHKSTMSRTDYSVTGGPSTFQEVAAFEYNYK